LLYYDLLVISKYITNSKKDDILKKIIILMLVLAATGCDKGQAPVAQQAPVSNNLKDQSQLAFEARAMPISKAKHQAALGTREREEASQQSDEFWKSVAGMEVKNWKCRYLQNFPWESGGDSNPELQCTNPNDIDTGSSWQNGRYTLRIMAATFPQKIYNGDLIIFSGRTTRGYSNGYIPNKTNYDLFVDVSSISVIPN
jgi:hypothetical protein